MKESDPFKEQTEKVNKIREGPVCRVYSREDFLRYLDGSMRSAEIKKFETHCHRCQHCAELLLKIVQEAAAPFKQKELMHYFQKTMLLLDKLDAEDRNNRN